MKTLRLSARILSRNKSNTIQKFLIRECFFVKAHSGNGTVRDTVQGLSTVQKVRISLSTLSVKLVRTYVLTLYRTVRPHLRVYSLTHIQISCHKIIGTSSNIPMRRNIQRHMRHPNNFHTVQATEHSVLKTLRHTLITLLPPVCLYFRR